MVTIDEVRRFAMTLPRSTEGLVAGRVKFRVGRIVYVSFSRDGTVMGFAFPKEERDWLVGGTPEKFMQPSASDLRYHWVLVRMAAIDETEMRELVLDAWRMVVPKGIAQKWLVDPAHAPARSGSRDSERERSFGAGSALGAPVRPDTPS